MSFREELGERQRASEGKCGAPGGTVRSEARRRGSPADVARETRLLVSWVASQQNWRGRRSPSSGAYPQEVRLVDEGGDAGLGDGQVGGGRVAVQVFGERAGEGSDLALRGAEGGASGRCQASSGGGARDAQFARHIVLARKKAVLFGHTFEQHH